MICPYCAQEIQESNKEHFFPQMVYPNDWDYYACRECNRLKGQHIVYPKGELFKLHPTELSIDKFKQLWKMSGNIKYLNIIPTERMIRVFNKRKWIYESSLFSIEERQFYELDKLKEIYEYYIDVISTTSGAIALVMSCRYSTIYYVHEFKHTILSPFPRVRPINIDTFNESHIEGWLMYGTTKGGLWRTVQSYTDYFNKLLGAPYSIDMLRGGV